jgi:hypothetical protein
VSELLVRAGYLTRERYHALETGQKPYCDVCEAAEILLPAFSVDDFGVARCVACTDDAVDRLNFVETFGL